MAGGEGWGSCHRVLSGKLQATVVCSGLPPCASMPIPQDRRSRQLLGMLCPPAPPLTCQPWRQPMCTAMQRSGSQRVSVMKGVCRPGDEGSRPGLPWLTPLHGSRAGTP